MTRSIWIGAAAGRNTRAAITALLPSMAAALGAALVFECGASAQAPPNIGVAEVKLRDTPYTFDTAEQHGIKVSVIARGIPHPFSLAFLPNGDALVAERGGRLRMVRHAADASQKAQLEA